MNSPSFLVVDDQSESLAIIRRTLSDAKVLVEHCGSTAEALATISDSKNFTGIIVRLQSRRIDGRSVVRACRAVSKLSAVPICVLVEESELEVAPEILLEGASEILMVPLEPRDVRMKCGLNSRRGANGKLHRVDDPHPIQNPKEVDDSAVDSFWSGDSVRDTDPMVYRKPLSKLVIPEVDSRSLRFSHGVTEQTVQEWQQDPTVHKVPLDRAMLCPECGGLPTFRYGCGNCGSAFHEPETIIHHYACAHIGGESEFRRGASLTCPKCLQKDLVAGSDFERVAGVFRCSDCNAIGNEPVLIGHCLCCHHRFLAQEAIEHTLTGYHVPVADPGTAQQKQGQYQKQGQRQFHSSHHASQKPPRSSKRRRRRSSSKHVSE